MNLFTGVRNSYLADGLSDEQVQAIVQVAEEIRTVDLQEVITENDAAQDIYILLEGKVRVTTIHGDPIARLQAGAILGELALFERAERSATVISDGEATLLKLSAGKFNALLDEHPQIGLTVLRNIGKTLCQRLRSSNLQLEAALAFPLL